MLCRNCKYFKNFKHTYGCDKYKKVIVNPNIDKDCYEGYDNNFMDFFNDIIDGKKGR